MCCATTTKKIKVLFLEVSLLKTIVPLKKKKSIDFQYFFPKFKQNQNLFPTRK